MIRSIASFVLVAALALSLLGQAAPASAAAGYDSAFSGESAFVDLAPGQSNTFQVFFLNTGTTTWTKGTATQVDLAVCLEDKTTCDRSDPGEAGFNPGTWLSATRYATTVQASVAPGLTANFVYDVKVPANATTGVHRFNGALVLASTGADIRNIGYFQDVNVTAARTPAALTGLTPLKGTMAGGTAVTISGSSITCTPTPVVLFGGTSAVVTSCGTTSLVVTSPAHAAGAASLTVQNAGAAPSNALSFEFVDDVKPTFDSLSATGQTLTLTFSEPVCVKGGTLTPDTHISAQVNGVDVRETGISFADCDKSARSATATLMVTEHINAGATVTVFVTTTGADLILDGAKNAMDLGQSRTAAATPDTTAPTIVSATADEASLAVLFSEPVKCNSNDPAQFVFDPDKAGAANVNADSVTCDSSATVTVGFPTDTFSGGVTGALIYTPRADPIQDGSGNKAAAQTVTIVPTFKDKPTITKASVTANGFTNSADKDDKITLVFSERMKIASSSSVVRVQDGDGTIADIKCTGAATNDDKILDASCVVNGDTMTITLLEDAFGETIADGKTAGLQWPATIIDTSKVQDLQLKDVDLAGSADKVIDLE